MYAFEGELMNDSLKMVASFSSCFLLSCKLASFKSGKCLDESSDFSFPFFFLIRRGDS